MREKGSYPNEYHDNFVGSFTSELLRNNIYVYGNNPFLTMFTTMILLEASQVNNGPVPTDDQLYLALELLGHYHDKNRPSGIGAVVYWPQKYNSTINQWYCCPINFMKTTDLLIKISEVVRGMTHDSQCWLREYKHLQGTHMRLVF